MSDQPTPKEPTVTLDVVIRYFGVQFHGNPALPNNREAWAQIAGDLHAAEHGATFAKIDLWLSPDEREHAILIVKVDVLDESEQDDQPYAVSEFDFDPQHHDPEGTWGDHVRAVIRDMGEENWAGMNFLQRSLMLFEQGMADPRQPGTYFDNHGDRFETLRAIMDDYGIPASALRDPRQYDVTLDRGDDGAETED